MSNKRQKAEEICKVCREQMIEKPQADLVN